MSSSSFLCLAFTLILGGSIVVGVRGNDFTRDFDVVWGRENARILDGGRLLELSLDQRSGSRIESKNRFLFGRVDLQIKLVAGGSAGTITSFYICSGGATHDEVDFEFLGNVSGEPYILHTNIFSHGKGGKEQQFYLWFDPTQDFHTYSILWNPLNIILFVDDTPIRVFKNYEAYGVPFPKNQPVRAFASIWDADDWATQGGRIKTDWSKAPFVASYRNFRANACVWTGDYPACGDTKWMQQELDWWSWMTLSWVRMNYLLYDYCTDTKRFGYGFPPECALPN
ncbi:xyloglucan endotransglucosylase/hydrolase protein 24-like [Ananas comosus]|uniref:Xyloglucan endotransglucosylase/hydrolase n=1 Tax=Ananas comosus TaxID=4615 RepID=A0A6P5F4G0_ANACO|nr:xyloglucan endotransglucosylase/hydrolase protein 24-like [Ananas comosus]